LSLYFLPEFSILFVFFDYIDYLPPQPPKLSCFKSLHHPNVTWPEEYHLIEAWSCL
jgi:hypothetical protein